MVSETSVGCHSTDPPYSYPPEFGCLAKSVRGKKMTLASTPKRNVDGQGPPHRLIGMRFTVPVNGAPGEAHP